MLRTRALIASKASHGRDVLLREIAQIEKDCELDEVQSLFDDRPAPRRPARDVHDGDDDTEHDETSHTFEHVERAIV